MRLRISLESFLSSSRDFLIRAFVQPRLAPRA